MNEFVSDHSTTAHGKSVGKPVGVRKRKYCQTCPKSDKNLAIYYVKVLSFDNGINQRERAGEWRYLCQECFDMFSVGRLGENLGEKI